MVQKLMTEYLFSLFIIHLFLVAVVEPFETATMVKSCTDGLAWLSVCVLISDIILPPEKKIINVRQQPCSVRSERDVGTYVEFCRLPERLGSSSNNINENNDNSNNNIITTLYQIPSTPSIAQDGEVQVERQHAVPELKPKAHR